MRVGTSCHVYHALTQLSSLLVPSSIYRTRGYARMNNICVRKCRTIPWLRSLSLAWAFPTLTFLCSHLLVVSFRNFDWYVICVPWPAWYKVMGYELQISANSVDKIFYGVWGQFEGLCVSLSTGKRGSTVNNFKSLSNPFLYSNIKFTALISFIRLRNPDL